MALLVGVSVMEYYAPGCNDTSVFVGVCVIVFVQRT